jgi:hypothetical protein
MTGSKEAFFRGVSAKVLGRRNLCLQFQAVLIAYKFGMLIYKIRQDVEL